MMEKNQYEGLNLIRAIASIGIILMHVLILGEFNFPLFGNAVKKMSSFVELFFILSGFAMSCGYYYKIKNGQISLDKFYKKRFIKVVPLFLVVVVVEALFTWEFPKTIFEVIANASMLFGFMSNNSLEVASLGWTLGVIFGFYVMFPFFVFSIYTKKRAWISLICSYVLHFVCQIYFLEKGQYQNIILWLFEFVIGGILFLYREELIAFFKKRLYRIVLVCGLIVITLFYYCGWQHGYDMGLLTPYVFSVWMIMGIISDGVLVNNRLIQYLGRISFEIYLLQMLVFRVVQRIGIIYLAGKGTIGLIFATVIVVSVCCVCASVWKKLEYIVKKLFLSK